MARTERPNLEDTLAAEFDSDLSEDSQMSTVLANGMGGQYYLDVPKDWALRFSRIDLDGSGYGIHNAKLSCDESCMVAFWSKGYSTFNAVRQARHEKNVGERLKLSGSVVHRFSTRFVDKTAFVLEEATDSTLEAFLSEYSRPKMLLKTSLPLLIDMLRGIRDLERSGVVHCDLTPKTIRLKGGRALIAGLKSAIILDDKDLRVHGKYATPRFAQAPELAQGEVPAASCAVWAVGWVFARMHMEGDPLQRAVRRLGDSTFENVFGAEAIIEAMHTAVGETFDIAEDPAFPDLDAAVKQLLPHLLDRNPETRWTAEEALQAATEMAKSRRIRVLPERPAPALPACWSQPHAGW